MKTKNNATTPSSTAAQSAHKPYKLGVTFSGGGARGFAHAGALMAIEEAGLKPDAVAGVSAWSVVAVLYAAGVKPLSMATIFARTGFRDFAGLSFGHGGIFDIEKFENFVMRALGGVRYLEDLRISTYIAATDLDHGCPVAFSTGEIGPRMIASCSIPIVFNPVKIDGVHYVDGGVLSNNAAWVLRDKCETLIGINVSPLRPYTNNHSILSVALRTYNLLTKAHTAEDMALCDVAVTTTELANFGVFDLRKIKELFLIGYKNTRHALIDAGMWQTSGGSAPAMKK